MTINCSGVSITKERYTINADNLADPRVTDPDKRALLLAGNRRGSRVPVKEPAGDKTWRTRYVSTYCPRLFSATRLPDAILASRTIVTPLIRTADRYRANADPLEYALWPHDRRKLLDDLWALALAHLPELPAYEAQANKLARLTGRNLEPWRALLAVALGLDDHGTAGLFVRLDELSLAYQAERSDLETSDITLLVIRALLEEWAKCANQAKCAKCIGDTALSDDRMEITASIVRKAALEIIHEDSLDLTEGEVTAQKIGKVLHRMRLHKPPQPGGKGPRLWQLSLGELRGWMQAYGLPEPGADVLDDAAALDLSPELGTPGPLGPLGTDVLATEPGREVIYL